MKTKLQLIFAAFAFGLVGGGCTVSEVIYAETSELEVASLQISESLLLDVGILHFDAGIPDDNDVEKTRIYPEVREAEARYLPYHIKTTLQGTGFWGAVRVIPSANVATDVIVSGKIEESDGEFVAVETEGRGCDRTILVRKVLLDANRDCFLRRVSRSCAGPLSESI